MGSLFKQQTMVINYGKFVNWIPIFQLWSTFFHAEYSPIFYVLDAD